ncbi:hypothetical protein RN001_010810 [Aquatica leii]|uniref:Scavenger receptor class B member 1 n=1 Tax=Aquatica leii TaxID=1421715 RepID=A0AAN7P726_9COLE|nr:hypothetical protein RN001_010810 [Aquatica leii]
MKDIVTNWNKLLGRTYSSVNTNTNHKVRKTDDCSVNSPRNVALNLLHGNFRSILTITFFGLIAFGSGLFILLAQPYDVLFRLKCVFSDGGEIFEMWRKPPVELYLRVFLFNVTNKDAFLNGEEKLRVEEVGPYVYKEMLSHEEIEFNENDTLTAIPKHPLVWVPELSEGRQEDDQLVLPHIALLSIAQVVSTSSFITRLGLNMVIRQTDSQPLVQMSAKEFMFGYHSTLMALGYRFLPTWINFEKLGLIDRMYDFDGDFETVFTGADDISKTGLLDTYRGSTSLSQWSGVCGNINKASDGTKFPGDIKPNDTLLFFRKSMCRALTMVRVNTTVASGLQGYVYNFEDNANDNGKYRPENSCFCNGDACLPAGLLDVHGCYYGFPIATSYPHFLEADPAVRQHVDGSNPDPAKHKSYFIIEPKSGLPLEVAARFQINMVFGDLESMAHVDQFSNMVLPLLWTDTRLYNLPDHLQTHFKMYLNVLPVVEVASMYSSFVLGGILLIVAIYKYLQKVKKVSQICKPTWNDDCTEEDATRKFTRSLSYNTMRRESLTDKELKNYYSSLVTPLNQDITWEEFQSLKEDDV